MNGNWGFYRGLSGLGFPKIRGTDPHDKDYRILGVYIGVPLIMETTNWQLSCACRCRVHFEEATERQWEDGFQEKHVPISRSQISALNDQKLKSQGCCQTGQRSHGSPPVYASFRDVPLCPARPGFSIQLFPDMVAADLPCSDHPWHSKNMYLDPPPTLLGPKYPLLGTIYPQLRVQGRSWYTVFQT